jgi:hypothetical protein
VVVEPSDADGVSPFGHGLLDLIHRVCEDEESFRSVDFMAHVSLWVPHVIAPLRYTWRT